MKAIRGATTILKDSGDEIKAGVKELLEKIKTVNNLSDENIICIMFSNTSDIRSYYPAKAAREAGFFNCALFSSLEPEIDGALKLCIRVMVLAEIDNEPKQVYLNGAENLRKDISKRLNIAIDGPAGSGKSTVSKIIAAKLNLLYLDTGAMYRACALACIRSNVDCSNEEKVKNILKDVEIDVKYDAVRNVGGAQITYLNGEDVSDKIRTPEISMQASIVSAHEFVRVKMVEIQRRIAANNSCVLDGRDIGTNVLPDADFKFYLNASDKVRAERRTAENRAKGINQPFDEVLDEIKRRDKQDKTRKIAPLIKAENAIEVDTGSMNADEVASYILMLIQKGI
ncbi:MAG: (d)CMP kinase [Clostridia bacterium]|nr:(d)CMP kinase [Clostridia bacterium]